MLNDDEGDGDDEGEENGDGGGDDDDDGDDVEDDDNHNENVGYYKIEQMGDIATSVRSWPIKNITKIHT